MAAPKLWGYTREKPITDELLVSWADGDLTAAVAKEVEERLLHDCAAREGLAAFARAAEDTRREGKREDGNRLLQPRQALVDACTQSLGNPPEDVEGTRLMALRPNARMVGGALLVLISLALAVWMFRTFV
jgi:anti-sigma factor RsiW